MIAGPNEASRSSDPLEAHLEARLDRLRDEAEYGDPHEYLRLFMRELEELPPCVSGTIRFRVKANIGFRHLALGSRKDASKWLLEAFDESPEDHRAITNKALGLWVRGDSSEAYEYGAEMLRANPANDVLASYLPQIAATVEGVEDPLEHVPAGLRDTEALVVAEAVFLRQRDQFPAWWTTAREGASRFPASKDLKVLSAFSHIDEITRDVRVQQTLDPDTEQRRMLTAAAATLDAYWQRKNALIKNDFDDVQYALAAAMVAHRLCGDSKKAIAGAERIAEARLDHVQIVCQAVNVAVTYGRRELAVQLTDLAPDHEDIAFFRAIIMLQDGDRKGAADLFRRARIPDDERSVVDAVVSLAEIRSRPADQRDWSAIVSEAAASPRALVLVARAALELGNGDIAVESYSLAKALISDESHIAARLMVAGLAVEIGTPSEVIELLDGHIPSATWDRPLERLAVAHATALPLRRRNVRFFEGLNPDITDVPAIARAHATVLFSTGDYHRAKGILLDLHDAGERDSYVVLTLLQCFRKLGDEKAAERLLKKADLNAGVGHPENDMALAAEVVAVAPRKGYAAAYELVRHNRERGDLATGYVGLEFMKGAGRNVFGMQVAGPDACVTIAGPRGDTRTVIIDEGPDLFGEVLSPSSTIAGLLKGKRKGDTILVPRLMGEPEPWSVTEIKSKYLNLHLKLLEAFETRYPGTPGISSMDVGEDLTNVFTMIRQRAEASERVARSYAAGGLPLAIGSQMLGGDPVSFSGYLHVLGLEIATCSGGADERDEAFRTAVQHEGRGVALDPYTAWVAADLDVLGPLRRLFGTVHVPSTALAMIDRMIAGERDGIGKAQINMSWHNGHFYREQRDDKARISAIEQMSALRQMIVDDCEVHHVVLPDHLSAGAEAILETWDSNVLDAALIATDQGVPLLSEDARYRQWCALAGLQTSGLWLQVALMAAQGAGHMTYEAYVKAVIGLAARGHGHVTLTDGILYVAARQDDKGLSGLKALLAYLATPKAEMLSHYNVAASFMELAWSAESELSPLRRQAATGAVLEAIISGRKDDGIYWLKHFLRSGPKNFFLHRYMRAWTKGHFLHLVRERKPVTAPSDRRPRRKRRA